jgi:hypothetical protein
LTSPDDLRALLRARKAVGPICGWCEAAADQYESEYCIDHDASSDLLHIAESTRTGCRAGIHLTREVYERRFSYHGRVFWPRWRRSPLTRTK